jgi:RNA polymerase sigma factor (TIGR02999 family)
MSAEITQLLAEAQAGDAEARSRLADVVYAEMHRLAAAYMHRERPDHSLQPTILVHEAFIRLVDQQIDWQSRAHFFALAAQTMRHILIDSARAHRAQKRGGGRAKVQLDDAIIVTNNNCEDLIVLDEALDRLAQRDARLSRLVELRFFAGLTEEETGDVLGVSARTVKRDWKVAKAWLHGELRSNRSDDAGKVAAR